VDDLVTLFGSLFALFVAGASIVAAFAFWVGVVATLISSGLPEGNASTWAEKGFQLMGGGFAGIAVSAVIVGVGIAGKLTVAFELIFMPVAMAAMPIGLFPRWHVYIAVFLFALAIASGVLAMRRRTN